MITAMGNFFSLPLVLFVRRRFSDATLGLGPVEQAALSAIKLSSGSLYGDRFYELKTFFGLNTCRLIAFFLANGWPFSKRLHNTLMRKFEGETSPGKLFDAYARTVFHYSTLLMLSMHRGEWLVPFLSDIRHVFPDLKCTRVLDYGCGVSDMGLMLGLMGCNVTICDLQTRRLDFAKWRFDHRKIRHEVIAVSNTEQPPCLPRDAYDMVLATEVLEHVRDPLLYLRVISASLVSKGLFFCSMGNSFEREAGGDHLQESLAIGKSLEYRHYFNETFELVSERDGHPWLFRKKQ